MIELCISLVFIALIGLNAFTIWFYQKQVNVLIDKAMSKSYSDYVQTKSLEQVDHFPKGNTQGKDPIEDDAVLNELNRIL
jgi:hypothetical protein